MQIEFVNYYQQLAQSHTCPGITHHEIKTIRGIDPWEDVDRCVTFRRWFDIDCVVLYYQTAQDLDAITQQHNQHADVTDTWCLFMDPHNPTNTNILQPPAPCVIIQSYSQLQNMRQQWQTV